VIVALNSPPRGSCNKAKVVETQKRRGNRHPSDVSVDIPNGREASKAGFGLTETSSLQDISQVRNGQPQLSEEPVQDEALADVVLSGPISDGVLPVDSLDRAIDVADAMAQEVAHAFGNRRAVIDSALAAAYPLSLSLLGDADGYRALVDHPYYAGRHKTDQSFSPNPKKPALSAVQFVLRPQDEAERKACSEYATMLDYAAAHGIASDNYAQGMRTVTLREAKQFMREKRKEVREARPKGGERGSGKTEPGTGNLPVTNGTPPAEAPVVAMPTLRIFVTDGVSAEVSQAFSLHPTVVTSLLEQIAQDSADKSLHQFLFDLSALAEQSHGLAA
jgi:hypothetical protein